MDDRRPEDTAALEERVRTLQIALPLAEVARVACDFAAFAAWHPAYDLDAVEGEGPGAVRRLSFGGQPEEHVLQSAEPHVYRYAVRGTPLPVDGVEGQLAVEAPAPEGPTTVRWTLRFAAGGFLPATLVGEMLDGLMESGLDGLETHLAAPR